MKTERELIQQMLDCIATLRHSSNSFSGDKKAAEAITAAREYLAAPEQSEPVAKYLGETPYGSLVQLYEDIPKGTELHTHPAPKAGPVNHSVIAGVLFDFMGWLTSRKERTVLSSCDDATVAVEAIKQFGEMRGLSLDDAQVKEWQDNLAVPALVNQMLLDACEGVARMARCGQLDTFIGEPWLNAVHAAIAAAGQSPQPAELTDEEIKEIALHFTSPGVSFARAVLAAQGAKK